MPTGQNELDRRNDSDLDRELISALEAVTEISESSADLANEVSERAEQILAQREGGDSWQQIVTSGSAPSLFGLLTRVITEFSSATSRLRRAFVHVLVNEGMRHIAIAEHFELSRQRIGAILKHGNRGTARAGSGENDEPGDANGAPAAQLP